MVCSMPVQPITVKLPHRFPYETDHQVPWGYGLEVVTSTGVKIEPEVAEIGGMTRSGRCYTPEELESKRCIALSRQRRGPIYIPLKGK